MKIANIILEPRLGGPQLRIARVGEKLKELYDIDTLVIFPKKGSLSFTEILQKKNLEFCALNLSKLSKNPFKSFRWFVKLIPETISLKKTIQRSGVDIVHCNSSWQFKGVIAAKLAGKKVVWHLNDTSIPYPIKIIFKKLNKFADGFIFAGSKVKQYYLNYLGEGKIEKIIHAPVDTEYFDPDKSIPDSVLKKKDINIITIANVNPVKGIETFLRSAYLIDKKFSDLHFYVIGGLLNSQKKYIKKIRALILKYGMDNFTLYGYSKSIGSILKDSDIYICSSINEAAPMSVWEAMSMKKPVISTDVGSVSDFIINDKNGFIVQVGDSEKIAEKIEYLINNKDVCKDFGIRSREIVKKELDISYIAKLHYDIYEEITLNF